MLTDREEFELLAEIEQLEIELLISKKGVLINSQPNLILPYDDGCLLKFNSWYSTFKECSIRDIEESLTYLVQKRCLRDVISILQFTKDHGLPKGETWKAEFLWRLYEKAEWKQLRRSALLELLNAILENEPFMELGYHGGKFWNQISLSFIKLFFHDVSPAIRLIYVHNLPALATDIFASYIEEEQFQNALTLIQEVECALCFNFVLRYSEVLQQGFRLSDLIARSGNLDILDAIIARGWVNPDFFSPFCGKYTLSHALQTEGTPLVERMISHPSCDVREMLSLGCESPAFVAIKHGTFDHFLEITLHTNEFAFLTLVNYQFFGRRNQESTCWGNLTPKQRLSLHFHFKNIVFDPSLCNDKDETASNLAISLNVPDYIMFLASYHVDTTPILIKTSLSSSMTTSLALQMRHASKTRLSVNILERVIGFAATTSRPPAKNDAARKQLPPVFSKQSVENFC